MNEREPGTPANGESFLDGGGQLGELIRSFDWSTTPLGPIKTWPQSLKTTVSLMLNSQHPMWIGWGPDITFLYNDAYLHVLGLAKHPWALGRPAAEVWSEVWDVCGPLADKVFQRGEATFVDDIRLFMRRAPDFLEETFYSFSYSPVRDETGAVGGLFCPSADVTAKNISARRLATLSDLAAHALVEKTTETACAAAAAILTENFDDIPFALLYLADSKENNLVLEQSTRLSPASPLVPPTLAIKNRNADTPWRISEVMSNSLAQIVDTKHLEFPFKGAADQPISTAIVLPLTLHGQDHPIGVLVAGTNPTRKLDSEYQTFFTLVTGQIATAIANARALEEERKRIEALAELDRAKTTFFSNVSHELRTPLTLMLGPLEDILGGSAERIPDDDHDRVSLAHRNGLRLLKLVNTLLDFSRIEAGRIQASFEPTDLALYTAELASVFRSAAEKAGLRLVVDCPPLPAPIYVDREMWEKIVLNLLSNAFKFTFEGEIKVTQHWRGETVELRVEDTGVGIPKLELPKIFDRFHRVRDTRSRTHEGTGIGLSLVRELARLHGGEVKVQSEEGKGTVFTVNIHTGKAHLPRERVASGERQLIVTRGANAFVDEAERWLPGGSFSLENPAELSGVQSLAGSDQAPGALVDVSRILLADDNADMREYAARLLSQRYHVETVADGRAALEAIQRNQPDLVLTDVMMPGLSGFELLAKLRSMAETRTLPVIMLSARAGEEARVEGLDAGADDYLIKPFSARELLARVASQLAMSSLRREGEERISRILNSIADGFQAVDKDWHLTYINSAAREMLASQGFEADQLLGKHFWDEAFPQARGKTSEHELRRAMAERCPVTFEHYEPQWQRWFSVRAYPMQEGGLSIYFRDISPEVKAREALEEAKEEAETASRAKDRFLAQLSHELRTPLTPVLMTAAVLNEDDRLPEDVKAQLGMIKHNIALEARLIDDLLDLTRIAHGKLVLRTEECDVHLLIENVVEIIRDEAREKNIHIALQLDAEYSCMSADSARLQQVFWNLLRNAIKFTQRGGRIDVSSRNTGSEAARSLKVEVKDDGIGFDGDFARRLFQPFEQAAQASSGGLGLGLAIARAVLELHRGSIKATSAGLKMGATFTVEVPGARAVILKPVNSPEATTTTEFPKESHETPLRLLLVEDHGPTLEVLEHLLARVGHQIVTARSVAEAKTVAETNSFDLVVSDLGLPDGTGIELMSELRARYGLSGIALSGYGMEEDVRRSSEAGFLAHLVKPVDAAELRRTIARVRTHVLASQIEPHASVVDS